MKSKTSVQSKFHASYYMLIFVDHTEADLAQKDTELTAGLGVAIGLMAIELVSKTFNITNK